MRFWHVLNEKSLVRRRTSWVLFSVLQIKKLEQNFRLENLSSTHIHYCWSVWDCVWLVGLQELIRLQCQWRLDYIILSPYRKFGTDFQGKFDRDLTRSKILMVNQLANYNFSMQWFMKVISLQAFNWLEVLRIRPIASGTPPRVTPPEGMTIGGRFIRGNVHPNNLGIS